MKKSNGSEHKYNDCTLGDDGQLYSKNIIPEIDPTKLVLIIFVNSKTKHIIQKKFIVILHSNPCQFLKSLNFYFLNVMSFYVLLWLRL